MAGTALPRCPLEAATLMAALAIDAEMRPDERESGAEMVEDRACSLLRVGELHREACPQCSNDREQCPTYSALSHVPLKVLRERWRTATSLSPFLSGLLTRARPQKRADT